MQISGVRFQASSGLPIVVLGLVGTLYAISFAQQIQTDVAAIFDVASVKASSGQRVAGRKGPPPFSSDPTRLAARNLTLKGLISRAYGIEEFQIVGGPTWIESDRYDIDATVENPVARERMLSMLQALLADRFLLKLHHETKPIQRYVLVVAKNGPKFGPHFHPTEKQSTSGAGGSPTYQSPKDGLKAYTMAHLAFFLSDNRDWWDPDATDGSAQNPPPVLDQTALIGAYDIVLNWASRRDWLTAFEQETGLKLELRRIPSEVLVVDSAAKPTPN